MTSASAEAAPDQALQDQLLKDQAKGPTGFEISLIWSTLYNNLHIYRLTSSSLIHHIFVFYIGLLRLANFHSRRFGIPERIPIVIEEPSESKLIEGMFCVLAVGRG